MSTTSCSPMRASASINPTTSSLLGAGMGLPSPSTALNGARCHSIIPSSAQLKSKSELWKLRKSVDTPLATTAIAMWIARWPLPGHCDTVKVLTLAPPSGKLHTVQPADTAPGDCAITLSSPAVPTANSSDAPSCVWSALKSLAWDGSSTSAST
eukprot:scaffold18065_cov111-Isochrysis_galbana.AAC.7